MIAGRLWPQLGGEAKLLDIVGLNYYHDNQWIFGGPPISAEPSAVQTASAISSRRLTPATAARCLSPKQAPRAMGAQAGSP